MNPLEFAIDTVQRLRDAGFEALFAGGCVRDRLMGKQPKDYDVATSARPEQVREVFGRKGTIAIGASFGVISRIGPKSAGHIEIATFRRDFGYSDGRRPDRVEYSDARQDARRRDFTINGIFYDPLTGEYHDYVDGRADIEEKIVRAIGNPHERIAEDKLRMLRAVRFTATFDFALDSSTHEAVRAHAADIRLVSGERIAAEMRRMLIHPSRRKAVELLAETELLGNLVEGGGQETKNRANWQTRLKWLDGLGAETRFETAATILFNQTLKTLGVGPLAGRWRLSNAETASIAWIHSNWVTLTRGGHLPWSQIQPLLIHPDAGAALQLAEAAMGHQHVGIAFCKERLKWPAEKLDPAPLIDGGELQALGLRPGPAFAQIITQVRAGQLDGEIVTKADAQKKALELSADLY
ncbi:MAG: CCA tRNA nucleotidyltransferase [Pirellulaceae bacterium]|nr:CCA tRNA nucleotidyltransferase [Pirellulaceae bacterium]